MPAPDKLTAKPLWTFHPVIIAMMAVVMGACIFAVFGVIWFRLDDESRATFSWFQRLTLLAFFGAILWLLYRMATLRVSAYEDGLQVRNVFKSYRFSWDDVKALRFNPGDPWLQLFDADGNRTGVLAVQASEGGKAAAAAKQLAAIARSHGAGPTN